MGLIKIALIAGAGIYASKKIAKASENRRNDTSARGDTTRDHQAQYMDAPDSKESYYYPGPPNHMNDQQQQSWRQPPPPPMEFVDRRSPQQQGQPLYLSNDPHSPLPRDYYREKAEKPFPAGATSGTPPQYTSAYRAGPEAGYGTYKQGFVETEEVSTSASDFPNEKENNRWRRGSDSAGGDEKARSGKGRDLFDRFLSK